jgi:hypothetical protein
MQPVIVSKNESGGLLFKGEISHKDFNYKTFTAKVLNSKKRVRLRVIFVLTSATSAHIFRVL